MIEHRERRAVAVVGAVLHRRLEVVAHHDREVGIEDRVDVVGGELEVVRLDPGRGEIADPDVAAPDLPDRLGEGVEGGNDIDAARRGGARRSAPRAHRPGPGRAAHERDDCTGRSFLSE